jgi:hypothetical protein
MSYKKTILCLANSRKPPSGRCVAGREVTSAGFGQWIRPVSARPTREISEEERRYRDGRDPQVLDLIEITMIRPEPQGHQRENHLIDDSSYWERNRRLSWSDLQSAVENPTGPLWDNGSSSSYGVNDRVSEERLPGLNRSLYLVRPERMRLIVAPEGGDFGTARRRVRADFYLSGHGYRLVMTDPIVERHLLEGPDGETNIEEALLCVSLGEVFHGFAYKLAAGVILPQAVRS